MPVPSACVVEAGVDAGNLGAVGGVRVEESGRDRIAQRLVQDRVRVGDGPTGERAAGAAAVLEQPDVVEVQLTRGQGGQRRGPERGLQVDPRHGAAVVPAGRLEAGALQREPLVEVVVQRHVGGSAGRRRTLRG
jgi:hypothetical protein